MTMVCCNSSAILLAVIMLLTCSTRAFPQHAPQQASSANEQATAPVRIVLIGDSTVCNYPATRSDRGWGMYLQDCFKPGAVEIINLAAAGRSTKTFIKQGRWKKALAEKPNYIMIQFGHNDSHPPEAPESTDAATDYKNYLRRYIDESRGINATPILVTPMVRRTFGPDGQLQDALQPYADAMLEVAKEKSVAYVDLHASSKKQVEELGPIRSTEWANKKGDYTHFNETGARALCDLIAKELSRAAPDLPFTLRTPSTR